MNDPLATRFSVENFVFHEADLLDRWQLDDWLGLWEPICRYEVTPTGEVDPEGSSPDETLFYIADDRFRLEQRISRLNKTSAHAEFPRSQTRHMFGNTIIRSDTKHRIEAQVSFVTYRTRRSVTNVYMGHSNYCFVRLDDGLSIVSKRVILDLAGLVPQGKVSIIL